jgi:hypothetical protein
VPSSVIILKGLTSLANKWQAVAIVFHLYFAIVLLMIIKKALAKRIAGMLLAIPAISVSVLAWMSRNPFNGIVFAVIAVFLLVFSARIHMDRIHFSPNAVIIIGILMVVFGWIYPHFLNTTSYFPYLYAAPVGVIPCPTLCVLIGSSLIINSLESRAWSIFLGIVGALYGLFGIRLGVALDWFLFAGAIILFSYGAFYLKEPVASVANT